MLTAGELASMRATAEETFVDSCTINEPSGPPVFDPDTGEYSEVPGALVLSSPCLIAPTGGERVVVVGGEVVTLRTYTVRLPWDSVGIAVDHVINWTAADPGMDDKALRVVDVTGRTTPIERVLIAEDTLG